MEQPTRRIALLIDADNVPAAALESILVGVSAIGVANVRQAFGDWHAGGLNKWKAELDGNGIKPVHQFAYTPGKNATDMAMTIAVVNLLRTWSFDAFAIASSDADFTPLVMHLQENGMSVHGYGEAKTPLAFVNACTTFTRIDLPKKTPVKKQAVTKAAHKPERLVNPTGNPKLVAKLRSSVHAAGGTDSQWVDLSAVASKGSINAGDYGWAKLSELVATIDHFETKRVGKSVHIRVKSVAKKTAKANA